MKNLSIEEQLKIDEGSSLTIYKDTKGYWTVGIGHLIKRDSTTPREEAIRLLDKELTTYATKGRITPAEQTYLFRKDLAAVQTGIAHSSFYSVYQGLDPVRQSAIQNMVFQLGILGGSKFKKMFAALAKGDYSQAAKEGFDSAWFKQTPNRARRVMETLRTGSTGHYPTK
ncbi:glycoside hydrolase family protein [Aeromonas rivipollensis]|uniref:glycoside hydrolase family protein n=1 Tax=Aeromonas rivipollensis TaxID=948519 RepID=UPI0013D3BEE7|nr:glycoside hydrolase family protein [Aeromonas rivipollensis]NEX81768.1 glycoside hydrolase family protein [Aeromonas rivipollensis]